MVILLNGRTGDRADQRGRGEGEPHADAAGGARPLPRSLAGLAAAHRHRPGGDVQASDDGILWAAENVPVEVNVEDDDEEVNELLCGHG